MKTMNYENGNITQIRNPKSFQISMNSKETIPQKNTETQVKQTIISPSEKKKPICPCKPGTRAHRQWMYDHPLERKKSYNRRWRTSKKERDELEQTFTARNSFSYSISTDYTNSNKGLARKEEYIYIKKHPEGYRFPERVSTTQVVFAKSRVTVTRMLPDLPCWEPPTPPQFRAAPPKKAKRMYGVQKTFAEFKPWDWKVWHHHRAEYRDREQQSRIQAAKRAMRERERLEAKQAPPIVMTEQELALVPVYLRKFIAPYVQLQTATAIHTDQAGTPVRLQQMLDSHA